MVLRPAVAIWTWCRSRPRSTISSHFFFFLHPRVIKATRHPIILYRRVTVPPAGLQGHPADAGAGGGPEAARRGSVRRRPDGGAAAPLPGPAGGAAVPADAGVQPGPDMGPRPGPRTALTAPGRGCGKPLRPPGASATAEGRPVPLRHVLIITRDLSRHEVGGTQRRCLHPRQPVCQSLASWQQCGVDLLPVLQPPEGDRHVSFTAIHQKKQTPRTPPRRHLDGPADR